MPGAEGLEQVTCMSRRRQQGTCGIVGLQELPGSSSSSSSSNISCPDVETEPADRRVAIECAVHSPSAEEELHNVVAAQRGGCTLACFLQAPASRESCRHASTCEQWRLQDLCQWCSPLECHQLSPGVPWGLQQVQRHQQPPPCQWLQAGLCP